MGKRKACSGAEGTRTGGSRYVRGVSENGETRCKKEDLSADAVTIYPVSVRLRLLPESLGCAAVTASASDV